MRRALLAAGLLACAVPVLAQNGGYVPKGDGPVFGPGLIGLTTPQMTVPAAAIPAAASTGTATVAGSTAPAAVAAGSGESYTEQTRRLLKALVRLDTSNPPGNEILAARYLQSELAKDGIASQIYTSTGTRASLIARLKGDGSRRPIVLMCHTDVVPADRSEWDTDPFEPVEKDGYLYGRGTADIKSMCAVEAAILSRLKRERFRLSRDLIFFAEADEETGNKERHIDWLMKRHGDLFAGAELGINEGGNTVWQGGKPAEIRVQAAEKEYMDLDVIARGQAGHASVPRSDNAVAALARAVTRLVEHRSKAEVNGVVRGFLTRQMETAEPQLKAAIDDVLKATPGPDLDRSADRLFDLNPEFGAMLRDTVTPTILKAGYKSNVIPAEAQATFNARLMPGRSAQDLVAELRSVIDDPNVEIRYDPPTRAPVPPMSTDTPLYAAAVAEARELAPDAPVMPFMAAWTTDSQDLRARGITVYGIDPPLTEEDGERVHGKNERLDLTALDWYARYLRGIVERAAGEPRPVGKGTR